MTLTLEHVKTGTAVEIALGIFIGGVTLACSLLWRDVWQMFMKRCVPYQYPSTTKDDCGDHDQFGFTLLSALLGTITATILVIMMVNVMLVEPGLVNE